MGGGSDDDSNASNDSADEEYLAFRADEEEEGSDVVPLTWVHRPPPAVPPPGPPAGDDDAAEAAPGPPPGPPAGDDDAAEAAPGPPPGPPVEANAPPAGPPPPDIDAEVGLDERPLFTLLDPLYAPRASLQAEGLKLMMLQMDKAYTRQGTPARNKGFLGAPMSCSRPTARARSMEPLPTGTDGAGREYAQGLGAEYGITVNIPSAQAAAAMLDGLVEQYDLTRGCVLCKACGHLFWDLPSTIKYGRRAQQTPEQLEELSKKTCARWE
jgi:hypothetical protein